MRRRLIRLCFIVSALVSAVGFALPAFADTGQDQRLCYVFSDTFPPVAPDAPGTDFVPVAGFATPLVLGDDAPSAPIPLPFVFRYFGRPYTAVTVSPNGFLKLGDAEVVTAGWPRGTLLPDARSPNGVIAGLWKDLHPSHGGSIVWAVVGVPPERRFVVQFTGVRDRDRPNVLNTFQIALAETTDEIVVRYAGASGSDLGAAAGVESESGAVGLTWRLDDFVLDRAAVRYTPLTIDSDGDGWSDCVDTCRLVPDFTQLDSDGDGTGDACELSTPPITVGEGSAAGSGNVEASRPDVAVDVDGNAIVVWDGPIGGRYARHRETPVRCAGQTAGCRPPDQHAYAGGALTARAARRDRSHEGIHRRVGTCRPRHVERTHAAVHIRRPPGRRRADAHQPSQHPDDDPAGHGDRPGGASVGRVGRALRVSASLAHRGPPPRRDGRAARTALRGR